MLMLSQRCLHDDAADGSECLAVFCAVETSTSHIMQFIRIYILIIATETLCYFFKYIKCVLQPCQLPK